MNHQAPPGPFRFFFIVVLLALPAGVIACFGTCTTIYWVAGQEYGDLGWANALRFGFIAGAVIGICVTAGVLYYALARNR